ncbi:hypothetical protein QBC47DRAFT_54013 [Echria macrotheca]|uniref:Uncharacterized protein n=1 Tax=Echria macrotheca TaxID=438768 RepID=A0AAJ0F9K0_9PEZI|nr:hypothetical protein QBC47DRAFT_54013 [Echria macrotheca]
MEGHHQSPVSIDAARHCYPVAVLPCTPYSVVGPPRSSTPCEHRSQPRRASGRSNALIFDLTIGAIVVDGPNLAGGTLSVGLFVCDLCRQELDSRRITEAGGPDKTAGTGGLESISNHAKPGSHSEGIRSQRASPMLEAGEDRHARFGKAPHDCSHPVQFVSCFCMTFSGTIPSTICSRPSVQPSTHRRKLLTCHFEHREEAPPKPSHPGMPSVPVVRNYRDSYHGVWRCVICSS